MQSFVLGDRCQHKPWSGIDTMDTQPMVPCGGIKDKECFCRSCSLASTASLGSIWATEEEIKELDAREKLGGSTKLSGAWASAPSNPLPLPKPVTAEPGEVNEGKKLDETQPEAKDGYVRKEDGQGLGANVNQVGGKEIAAKEIAAKEMTPKNESEGFDEKATGEAADKMLESKSGSAADESANPPAKEGTVEKQVVKEDGQPKAEKKSKKRDAVKAESEKIEQILPEASKPPPGSTKEGKTTIVPPEALKKIEPIAPNDQLAPKARKGRAKAKAKADAAKKAKGGKAAKAKAKPRAKSSAGRASRKRKEPSEEEEDEVDEEDESEDEMHEDEEVEEEPESEDHGDKQEEKEVKRKKPAKAPAKAKAKAKAGAKKAKESNGKEAARDKGRKNAPAEKSEQKQKQSRKSSAYHKAVQTAKSKGLPEEECKELGRAAA